MKKIEKNILIALSGSVATIKLELLLEKFKIENLKYNFNIQIIVTEHAKHFLNLDTIKSSVILHDDAAEWQAWQQRGDPVLHIELGKWADLLLISPLSANTLAKISTGICDNLLTCVVRAWDLEKPLFFCPAMNTRMYDHPLTGEQITKLKSWGYYEIPCISKTLMCGDTGNGAMAEVDTIAETILNYFNQ